MKDRRVHVVADTGSTNADVRARADDWLEGTWLRAERQSAGQGRLGRRWESPSGNLYASTLIRLRPDDPPITGLSLMLGVAVHSALSELMPDAGFQLKWPNDVMAGSGKLAGMLLEKEGQSVVAGVGVNVASAPDLPDRETVALAELAGGAGIDAEGVLLALLLKFDEWLGRWRQGGTDAIIPAWTQRAHPRGTPLVVKTGTATPQLGRFQGLHADGALILLQEDGTSQIIRSGDVGILP